MPKNPWERIHVDFAGPYLGKMFLITVDAYSKWIEVDVTSTATASATVGKMRRIFATHGLPLTLVSDNGPSFVGEEFKDFLLKNGVRHILTAPYHPSSNGQAERMVRVFKESMRCLSEGDIETRLYRLLFAYRMTPSTATGKSPAELLFQRQPRSQFDRMLPKSSKENEDPKDPKENKKDKEKKVRVFEENDSVWVKNFGEGKKWVAGTILKRTSKVNYQVASNDKILHRHIDQLIVRVPKVGTTPKVREDTTKEKDKAPAVNETITKEARPKRQSNPPTWTKDFRM